MRLEGLLNADTPNNDVELFPGMYIVALNGTTQSQFTVRAGEKATVSAGSAVVTGNGVSLATS